MNILEWAGGEPLAIDPNHLDRIEATLAGADQLAVKAGVRSESSRVLSVRDGVGIIEIQGVISRRESFWSWLLGGTSTEAIGKALNAAMEDDGVKSILLHVDSPGGQATGVGELAGYVRKATKTKPVAAYIEGMGASAMYYVPSAASEVVIAPAASVGSIGTIVYLDGRSRPGELVVVSSQSPGKMMDPKTKDGLAAWQAWTDSLSAVFIADVARYRGVSEKTVLNDFGKGGILVGQAAVDAGMVDGLGDFESVFMSMRDTGRALPSKVVSRRRSAERGGKSESRQGKHMNPFSVLASLWAKDPESVQEAVEAENKASAGFSFLAPASKVESKATVKSETDLRAEIEAELSGKFEAKAKADARASVEASAKDKASEWVKSLGDKIAPAQANNLGPVFASLVVMDSEAPLSITREDGSTAPVSRVQAFKDAYESRGSLGLTKEVVPSDKAGDAAKMLAKAGRVLPNADDVDAGKGKVDDAALLAMSPVGRKAAKLERPN